MNTIYKPSGAAAEYGEYALNIYTGCPHRCSYCYVPGVRRMDREKFHSCVEPRKNIVDETKKYLAKTGMTGETIFLCFTCDPFPYGFDCTPTLEVIDVLKQSGNHVKILTKGIGLECFDMLDSEDWYGITDDGTTYMHGPLPSAKDRYVCLVMAHKRGIKTWISYEPVVYAHGVLGNIECLPELYDGDRPEIIKIGKLNYQKPPMPIDWAKFGRNVVELCEQLEIPYYIKDSLRKEMEKV